VATPNQSAQNAAPLPAMPFGRPYELMVVFKPGVEVESVDGAIRVVENAVRQLRGKFLKVEKIGRKRLAYEIKKQHEGWIVNIVLQLSATQVKELRRQCALNESILRAVLLQLPKTYDLLRNANVNIVSKRDRALERAQGAEEGHQRGERGDRGPAAAAAGAEQDAAEEATA